VLRDFRYLPPCLSDVVFLLDFCEFYWAGNMCSEGQVTWSNRDDVSLSQLWDVPPGMSV
jgi:hypothetical protein